ncbi:hypothetical protein MXM59_04045 [Mammaliicoccus sciuri]|uniref:hypothetical protein n=1 Tax=Mammaliicoccus sciuri TaxID=1296 RepID=UPI0017833AF5|nr:hypothetical protein [Mammaliicoccus sciuri]MEB6226383.1 hypothetical protein [Mammaliicoccus sciuri]
MPRAKSVKVTSETKSGRNTRFKSGSKSMSRSEFVKGIKSGKFPGYHVRNVNGKATPVSNPDKSSRNNLG